MDSYLRFIGENEKFFDRTKNQMISYWNCYYRLRYPNKESQIKEILITNSNPTEQGGTLPDITNDNKFV